MVVVRHRTEFSREDVDAPELGIKAKLDGGFQQPGLAELSLLWQGPGLDGF